MLSYRGGKTGAALENELNQLISIRSLCKLDGHNIRLLHKIPTVGIKPSQNGVRRTGGHLLERWKEVKKYTASKSSDLVHIGAILQLLPKPEMHIEKVAYIKFHQTDGIWHKNLIEDPMPYIYR